MREHSKEAVLFLKKNQKIFGPGAMGEGGNTAHDPDYQSFFASFCSQKEALALP
jgi:hypothetical protein